MDNLEVVNNALMKLSEIDFEELSEGLQQTFIIAQSALLHISTVLEQKENKSKWAIKKYMMNWKLLKICYFG